MMDKNGASKEAFLDDLAPLVDGERDVLHRHEALLAADADARDLAHDAGKLAEELADAGADHRPVEALDAKVLAALDARGAAAAAPAGRAIAPAARPEAAERRPDAAPAPAPKPSSPTPSKGPLLALVGGLAALATIAAVVLGLVLVPKLLHRSADAPPPPPVATWSGRIDAVAPAGDASGLRLRAAGSREFASARVGAAIPRGTTLRTDERTRARVVLDDGTTLVLDHDSELELGDRPGRSARLAHGQLLAEVAHREDAPHAIFRTPKGEVEVVGTKLVLSASDDLTSVRVTQGVVSLSTSAGKVEVLAGDEGLADGGAPRVVPALDLASSIRFSELDTRGDEDLPVPGLGELRARKPGEREERERPLTLAEHVVRVRIAGPVARTEIEEVFQNDSGDVLEGVYRFPLPEGARIASLALEVDGRWEEGAFVARERAAQIFRGVIRHATPVAERRPNEEYIWVPGPWRDPALLEWQRGGRFELRIFPIPAHGARRVRIAYEQNVVPQGSARRYVYPLPSVRRGDARVGRFVVDARIAGADVGKPLVVDGYPGTARVEDGAFQVAYQADSFAPTGDLALSYVLPDPSRELRYYAFRGSAVSPPPATTREQDPTVHALEESLARDPRGYVVFALRPELPAASSARPTDYAVVVDTSQSMTGARLARATRLATALVSELDRRHRVTVLACDLGCRPAFDAPEIPGSEAAEKARVFLASRRAAGSSDVSASIEAAADALVRSGRSGARAVIYVGDGTSTTGATTLAELRRAAERIARKAVSVTTVGIGQDADSTALSTLARIGGGHHVPFVPGQSTLEAAMAVLETTYGTALVDATVTLPPGLSDVAPAALPSLRAGEELTIAARVSGAVEGELVLRGKLGGAPFERRYPIRLADGATTTNAFVPRLWAEKRIGDLELEGGSEATPTLVALSKSYGVMSRGTSLLVLESEAMFQAFGVDRPTSTLAFGADEELEESVADAVGDDDAAAVGDLGAGALAGASSGFGRGASSGEGAAENRARSSVSADAFAEEAPMRAERAAPAAPAPSQPAGPTTSATARPAPPMPPVMPPRGGRWMRKVWFREGHVDAARDTASRMRAAVAQAEAALGASPESRDRRKALYRALSRAGELERAKQTVDAWLEKDPNDVEAIVAASDLEGRLGNREEALRLLSGIVDAEPGTKALHERLASVFEREGRLDAACAERRAIAATNPSDAASVAPALRCLGALGAGGEAAELLARIPDPTVRTRATTLASSPSVLEAARGDVVIEASWSRPVDLDLSLIAPDGTRYSLLGGRAGVVVEDATASTRERLGLRTARVGTYVVEIARTGDDRAMVQGTVRVRALGETRSLPFTLVEGRAAVAQIEVVRRWRLEPM